MRNWRLTRSLVAASVVSVLAGSTAWAQPAAGELEAIKRMVQEVISQNEGLRRRVRELEAGKTGQGPAISNAGAQMVQQTLAEPATESAKEPTKDPAPESKPLPGWLDKLQFGGAVEVEARHTRGGSFGGSGDLPRRNFANRSETVFELKTAEFDFEAKLSDWATASLNLEWQSPPDDKITVNEAFITFASDSFPLSLKAGRGTLPFGVSTGSTVSAKFETQLTLTDPLPIAVFDAKEDHALLGIKLGGFHASGYVFTGDTQRRPERRLEHYGAALGYGMATGDISLVVGLSMMDSVMDTDGLSGAFPEALNARYVPGIAAHIRLGAFGISLVTAYYTALREIQFVRGDLVHRIQPAAWYVELGYTRDVFGYKSFAALSYSETEELAGAFPKKRAIATVGTWLLNTMRLHFDYAYDQDYRTLPADVVDRPRWAGRTTDTFILRLTTEW